MSTKTTSPKTFTCRQVLSFFGKTARADRQSFPKEVRAHLKTCQPCTHHFTSLQVTLAVFGTRVNVPTPPAIRQYIEKRLTEAVKN